MTRSGGTSDAELLARWQAQIESEQSRGVDVDAARRTELRAVEDLLRAGLDADRGRRFRADVLLTIRCRPTGRVLAQVYRTTVAPVLIPAEAEPAIPIRTPATRYSESYQRAKLDAKRDQVLRGAPAPVHREWLCVRTDDDGVERVGIPGARVLTPGSDAPYEVNGVTYQAEAALRCPNRGRCGTHWVRIAAVLGELSAGYRAGGKPGTMFVE
ncbi:MAG: hypothetical protein BGP03_17490 [Pseudonocardia sp. 73-21]|nr:MAG: hypothetical protein BGP03_17490 [Pseudonocardia sp. 73-21]